jgi:hypothetical protein
VGEIERQREREMCDRTSRRKVVCIAGCRLISDLSDETQVHIGDQERETNHDEPAEAKTKREGTKGKMT